MDDNVEDTVEDTVDYTVECSVDRTVPYRMTSGCGAVKAMYQAVCVAVVSAPVRCARRSDGFRWHRNDNVEDAVDYTVECSVDRTVPYRMTSGCGAVKVRCPERCAQRSSQRP